MKQLKPGSNQPLAKIEELESLRGLAALLVAFYHIPKWNQLLNIQIIDNGHLMVGLFFVLSGFVIFNAYANKIASLKDLIRFQFLRFGRIYPVHILFLCVFIFIEAAKYFAHVKFGIVSPERPVARENNITALIQNIFLAQAIGPTGHALTFNAPSWSISVEFYTYLVFAISVLLFSRMKILVFVLLAIVSVLMLATESTFGFTYLLRCFSGFFIGCLTAYVVKDLKIILPKYISLIVFFIAILFMQIGDIKEDDVVIYFLSAALIATLVLSPDGLLNRILKFRLFTWLGAISYSIYMSHAAIVGATNQFLRLVLKAPQIIAADGKNIPQLSENVAIIATIIFITVVLIVSTIVYNFFEKPLRDKSRRIAFSKLK